MNLRHIYRRSPAFVRFLLVGAVGFIVDAMALLLLVHLAQMSAIWARIPSFLIAVTVTWWLHRNFTFEAVRHSAPSVREWLFFILANSLGNGLNLGLYWLLIVQFAWVPLAALAFASVVAAAINFHVSAKWVFRGE
ncbi:MAG: GtrA family protein [Betaproteobacteria bacterium]